MPDPLHPAGYRAAANTPTPPPSETPPSLIDSQLENLQAANRRLRDDLARAERERDRAERILVGLIGAAKWAMDFRAITGMSFVGFTQDDADYMCSLSARLRDALAAQP